MAERNAALSYLNRRFFDHITVSDEWLRSVREAAGRGAVVYVLRAESFVDVLALDHLVKRFGLPPLRFAQDTGLWMLEPLGWGWVEGLLPGGLTVAERLDRALAEGGSALLFLKRPPTLFEASQKAHILGKSEGDEALLALIARTRAQGKPVMLVPQTFIWSRRPDSRGLDALDMLFGPRAYPGLVRTAAQFVMNFRSVDFRSGDPIDLGQFLKASGDEGDEALVRRLTYTLLRRLERERQAILGPAQKPADRVREEVLRSPRLQATIRQLGGEDEQARKLLTAKAYRMMLDMEAAPSHEGHRAFKIALDAAASRIFAGIEVDREGIERVREASKRGSVVFLPSHKSHMDYIMLSNVLHEAHIQLPLIAAGDNLAFFPMGAIFRRGGAFFIRRSFKGDQLYAAVVDAYLRRLVRDGHSIEVFIEGGRSRTGKLLPPKMGLLGMICDAALSLSHKPVTFFPVSIGYERLLEEQSYQRELSGGDKRKEDARSLLRGTKVLGGFYGRVNVQFGEPLTLDRVRAELGLAPERALAGAERRATVTRLAHAAMAEINRITSATAASVVAMALLAGGKRGVAHGDLLASCRRVVAALGRRGARLAEGLRGRGRDEAVRQAIELFSRAELCQTKTLGDDAVYAVPDDKRLPLSIPRNNIVHFFIAEALVCAGMLGAEHRRRGDEGLGREALRERVQALSRLFKFEFMFRVDKGFDALFDETLARLDAEGITRPVPGDRWAFGPGVDGLDGVGWAVFFADLLAPYLLGYQAAARALSLLLKGPLSRRDLPRKSMAVAERMFLSGDIDRREALSRPTFENALLALEDQKYIADKAGKLALLAPFDTPETVGLVEAKIRALSPRLPGVSA